MLIVIGYSFPTFNREVDKELLYGFFSNWNFTHDKPLPKKSNKKLFIQVPQQNFEGIKNRVWSLIGDNTELITRPDLVGRIINPIYNLDEFYIPPEFDDLKE